MSKELRNNKVTGLVWLILGHLRLLRKELNNYNILQLELPLIGQWRLHSKELKDYNVNRAWSTLSRAVETL